MVNGASSQFFPPLFISWANNVKDAHLFAYCSAERSFLLLISINRRPLFMIHRPQLWIVFIRTTSCCRNNPYKYSTLCGLNLNRDRWEKVFLFIWVDCCFKFPSSQYDVSLSFCVMSRLFLLSNRPRPGRVILSRTCRWLCSPGGDDNSLKEPNSFKRNVQVLRSGADPGSVALRRELVCPRVCSSPVSIYIWSYIACSVSWHT